LSSKPEQTVNAIGVDIGGTKIAAGYLDAHGIPVSLGTAPTTPFDGAANAAAVRQLIDDPRVANAAVLAVSVATTFDDEDRLRDPRGWFGWPGENLAHVLGSVERPAVIIADAAAGAMGEYLYGEGQGCRHLLYLTVGTGLSHCLVLDGEPVDGAHNAAYFSGYIPQGRCAREQCDFPHVEAISAGPAIARAYLGSGAHDARPVFEAAAAGDERAIEVVEHAAWHLGALMATLLSIYDPGRLVIGGGLGTGVAAYRDRAIAVARELVTTEHARSIPIVPAALHSESCWVGAIGMASVIPSRLPASSRS
jgi:glucokinase